MTSHRTTSTPVTIPSGTSAYSQSVSHGDQSQSLSPHPLSLITQSPRQPANHYYNSSQQSIQDQVLECSSTSAFLKSSSRLISNEEIPTQLRNKMQEFQVQIERLTSKCIDLQRFAKKQSKELQEATKKVIDLGKEELQRITKGSSTLPYPRSGQRILEYSKMMNEEKELLDQKLQANNKKLVQELMTNLLNSTNCLNISSITRQQRTKQQEVSLQKPNQAASQKIFIGIVQSSDDVEQNSEISQIRRANPVNDESVVINQEQSGYQCASETMKVLNRHEQQSKRQLEQANNKFTELSRQFQQSLQQVQCLKATTKDLQDQIKKQRETVKRQETTIREKQHKIKQYLQNMANRDKQITDLKEQNQKLEKRIQESQVVLRERQKELESLAGSLRSAQQATTNYQRRDKEKDSKIANYLQQIDILKVKKKELEDQMTFKNMEFKNKIFLHQKEIASLKQQKQAQKSKRDQTIEENSRKIKEYQQQNREQSDQLKRKDSWIDQLDKKVKDARRESDALKQEIQRLKTENEKLANNLAGIKSELRESNQLTATLTEQKRKVINELLTSQHQAKELNRLLSLRPIIFNSSLLSFDQESWLLGVFKQCQPNSSIRSIRLIYDLEQHRPGQPNSSLFKDRRNLVFVIRTKSQTTHAYSLFGIYCAVAYGSAQRDPLRRQFMFSLDYRKVVRMDKDLTGGDGNISACMNEYWVAMTGGCYVGTKKTFSILNSTNCVYEKDVISKEQLFGVNSVPVGFEVYQLELEY